jgi:hypothetical protein
MKKLSLLCAMVFMVSFLSGCYTTGLSSRETAGFNYSNFVYGLYDGPSSSEQPSSQVHLPLRIAIAQVGEAAPPKLVKDKLVVERSLVRSVAEIPAGGAAANYNSNQKSDVGVDAANQVKKMLALSKDLNADYLFVFGGTADISQSQGWVGALDFSIVGMFIFPSQDISIEGKASGALIDVKTGRIIYIVSSQNEANDKATTISVEGKKERVLSQLRNKLLDSLTEELIAKLRALDDGIVLKSKI